MGYSTIAPNDDYVRAAGLSVSEQNATVQVIEQWRGNDMVRYTRNPDGTKTVLEHYTNVDQPFVKIDLSYPVPYTGRALSVSELNDSNDTR